MKSRTTWFNRVIGFCFAILISGSITFGQSNQEGTSKVLKERLVSSKTTDEMREVLETAEMLASNGGIEGKSRLVELRFLAHNFLVEQIFTKDRVFVDSDFSKRDELFHSNAKKLELDSRHLISLLENSGQVDFRVVKAKVELARFLESYELPRTKTTTIREKLQRIRSSQDLYSAALKIERGRNPAPTANSVSIMLFLANSYMESADFERALPLLEEYVEGVVVLEGERSPALSGPVFRLASIVRSAGDGERFNTIRSRFRFLPWDSIPQHQLLLTNRANPDNEGINEKEDSVHLRTPLSSVQNTLPPPGPGDIQRGTVIDVRPERDIQFRQYVGIPTHVVVGPDGRVISVNALTGTEQEKRSAAERVKTWRFRPYTYRGIPSKLEGIVRCWVRRSQ